jgi:hypothetical protein
MGTTKQAQKGPTRQTDRQTDSQDRQTAGQTDRRTDQQKKTLKKQHDSSQALPTYVKENSGIISQVPVLSWRMAA